MRPIKRDSKRSNLNETVGFGIRPFFIEVIKSLQTGKEEEGTK